MIVGKYQNRKVVVDHVKFDSRKEANRYCELKIMEKAGLIRNLELQKKFVLIPTQREGKKVIEKECSYIADFVYEQNGQTVVEDVKGYRGGEAYTTFVIKRKLMLFRYGLKVREI